MKELAIQALTDKYKKFHYKYTKQFRNFSNNSDKYFEMAVDIFNKLPQIDQDLYIEAQFYFANKFGRKCTPSWLTSEKAIERYTSFLTVRDTSTVKEKVPEYRQLLLDSIKSSVLFINRKMAELGLKTYRDALFYSDQPSKIPKSYTWIMTKQITKPFLCVLKAYPEYHASLDPDLRRDVPSPDDMAKTLLYIKISSKIRKFCVSIMGDECRLH